MGNINDAALQELAKSLNAKWTAAYAAPVQAQLLSLATAYSSSTASNHYAFMEALGGWSEWNGARQFKDVASQDYQVLNKDFEMSIKMPKNQIEDDQIGMYVDLVPQMVQGWFKKQQALIMNVLTANPLAYDGVALFSAAGRTYGDNTIANKVTTALSSTTFEAARVAMMSYLDHSGEPLAVMPDTLVVGPALEKTAYDVVKNYFGIDSTSTIQVENFFATTGTRIVVSPYLVGDYANYWYLADTSDVVKGVLLQIREIPSPILSNAQEVARNKTVDYMADGRMVAAPAAPHKIYGGFKSA
jgi:phage major head subunit gpT-like protein